MTTEELQTHIWIDPTRCGGRPCIRDHRIWVTMVLDLLALLCRRHDEALFHFPSVFV
jgi:uncharacterized protein (DUF433 family)